MTQIEDNFGALVLSAVALLAGLAVYTKLIIRPVLNAYAEAETKEDREIVIEEVFIDVTGRLDETAQAQLGAPERVPFYVVLAKHYATPKGADSAVVVLHLLQSLYGQGYAAPLVALLLHRWLLMRRAPGRGLPEEQRTRVVNALSLGSAQLFMGDVHGGAFAFEPLWHCLCHEVILGERSPVWFTDTQPNSQPSSTGAITNSAGGSSGGAGAGQRGSAGPVGLTAASSSGLVSLSLTARTALLAITAAFLVYYTRQEDLAYVLKWFPAPNAPPSPSLPLSGSHTALDTHTHSQSALDTHTDDDSPGPEPPRTPPLVSPPYQGVDFVMMEVVDVLGKISTEAGLVRYLMSIQRLKGQTALTHPDGMRLNTRLKLQSALTAMAAPGGPRYYPYAVGNQALQALDALFPNGQGSRRLARAMFRLLHPADWAGDLFAVAVRWVRAVLSALVLVCFKWLHTVVLWGAQGGVPSRTQSGSLTLPHSPPSHTTHYPPASPRVNGTADQQPDMLTLMRRSSPRRLASRTPQPGGRTPRASLDVSAAPRAGVGMSGGVGDDVVVVSAKEEGGEDMTRGGGGWVVPEPVQASSVESLLKSPATAEDTQDTQDTQARQASSRDLVVCANLPLLTDTQRTRADEPDARGPE